jgi:stress-induced-phosphoprotein 1
MGQASGKAHQRVFCQDWAKAAEDADACIKIKPDWGKGYGRKGAALHGMGDLQGAHETYTKGLQVEPGVSRCRAAGMSAGMSCDEALLAVSVVGKGPLA